VNGGAAAVKKALAGEVQRAADAAAQPALGPAPLPSGGNEGERKADVVANRGWHQRAPCGACEVTHGVRGQHHALLESVSDRQLEGERVARSRIVVNICCGEPDLAERTRLIIGLQLRD